jgi:hypothetical protein
MVGSVFICYSRNDERFVLDFAMKLKEKGVLVWLDQWDIPFGLSYIRAIEEALTSCSCLLVVLSPDSVESSDVESEWHKALRIGKPVIPVLYKNCKIPYLLDTIPRIDFTSERTDDDIAFNKLFKALGMAEIPLQKIYEVITPKKETLVSATDITIDNPNPVGSDVSDAHTFPKQIEVAALYKPDVYIDDIKYSTIQEAVNSGIPGKTIDLVAGTYQENLRIDKSFTIKGAGVGKTIIDGCRGGSVIFVGKNRAEIDVTLTGITVKGGTCTEVKAAGNDPNTNVCGGGIINHGNLTITDCIISDNEAYFGGGIFNRGTLNLEKGASVIHNAGYDGGGIYNQGGVRSLALVNLNGCSIEKNQAKQRGAGIYSVGNTVNIYSGTTISGNIAGNSGGGIYLAPSKYVLKMYGGDILDNHAVASGGGIFSYGGNVHLKGGSIHINTATHGAGVENASGGLITLDGARIHKNIADRNGNGEGGGIMNVGTLILNSGSIDHNHASINGGGICNNKKHGKWEGNLALVHDNTLGSDRIPDDIALC